MKAFLFACDLAGDKPNDRDPDRHPTDEDPWGWACGFYPGSHPGNVPTARLAVSTEPRSFKIQTHRPIGGAYPESALFGIGSAPFPKT